MAAVLLVLILPQADLAERLKAGRWDAVAKADPKDRARLEELAKSEDRELQWWAGAAIADLDSRDLLPPLKVTLAAKSRVASSLLEEILGLAGLKLAPAGNATGTAIDVDFRDAPFLAAVDEVCRKGRVSLYRQENAFRVAQMGAGGEGPRFCAGLVAANVRQVTHLTAADFLSEPSSHVTVGLGVWLDPRLRIRGRDNRWSVWSAEDDRGKPLPLRKGLEQHSNFVHASAGGMFVQASLETPPADARRIALLRGQLTVTLTKKTEDLLVEKLSSGESSQKKVGPVEARVLKCERAGAAYEVVVELTTAEKGWQGPEMDEFALENSAGARFRREHRGSRSGWKYTLNFRAEDGLGAPERLRVPLVVETVTRQAYFELRDISLP
jgi:hypothetical protein